MVNFHQNLKAVSSSCLILWSESSGRRICCVRPLRFSIQSLSSIVSHYSSIGSFSLLNELLASCESLILNPVYSIPLGPSPPLLNF